MSLMKSKSKSLARNSSDQNDLLKTLDVEYKYLDDEDDDIYSVERVRVRTNTPNDMELIALAITEYVKRNRRFTPHCLLINGAEELASRIAPFVDFYLIDRRLFTDTGTRLSGKSARII